MAKGMMLVSCIMSQVLAMNGSLLPLSALRVQVSGTVANLGYSISREADSLNPFLVTPVMERTRRYSYSESRHHGEGRTMLERQSIYCDLCRSGAISDVIFFRGMAYC
jgi:hypothetical protein